MPAALSPDDLLMALPVPAFVVGADGRLGTVNAAAETIIGPGLEGRHFRMAFRQNSLIDPLAEAIAGGEGSTGRLSRRLAGRETAFEAAISPLGRGHGVLVTLMDLSHQEEAGERRSEFVANVSHELRTPLTAIAGFVETLRGPARDDAGARERFLEIMAREADRMMRLVDDLLSLARVEDVERVRPVTEVDLAAIARSVLDGLSPQAQTRAVTLACPGCDSPVRLMGDADQLTQVLTNLVTNAIKYGREGGTVEVRLETRDFEPLLGGPAVALMVRDEGEGIAERHLARLTERFYRVDSHRSRGMGGTGLGLAIVKHIVNRHRGRLRIESTPGVGSVFSILLPIR